MSFHVAVCAGGRGLAEARALAQSLRRFHPDWPITCLVLPAGNRIRPSKDEPFELLYPLDLDDPVFVRSLTATAHDRQAQLAGPLLVSHLLRGGAQRVLLLASDTVVLGPVDGLADRLDSADAIVAPRLLGVLPDDGERPDASDLATAGEVDPGFLAVRNTAPGRAFVGWWSDYARDGSGAIFAIEQSPDSGDASLRYDVPPSLAALRAHSGVHVLEDPAYQLSAWNLHERNLTAGPDDAPMIDGERARTFRFSGFDPLSPWWLSDDASRVRVRGVPVLERLCRDRAEALLAAGWPAAESTALGRYRLGNGLRYDERLRRLHLLALHDGEDFGDIHGASGAAAFTDWLNEPAATGGQHGLTRYHHDVWQSRVDLVRAYADLDDASVAEGFAGWLWVHGRSELNLQAALLPSTVDWAPGADDDVPSLLVTGYLRGVVGLGEAARRYVEAAETAGIPVATSTLPTDPPGQATRKRRGELVDFATRTLERTADVHMLCVNPEQTTLAIADLPEAERPAYVIGNWAWETDVIPERWDAQFAAVDEVWVSTSWIAENIGAVSPVPVVVMPIPVTRPEVDPAGPGVELPDAFTFLFTFDHFSSLRRKNPLAVIAAFRAAFEPGEGPALVLKTINAALHPRDATELAEAAAGRDDIRIVDGVMSPGQLGALMAHAGCYVSLHRAEGFGMTMAESMSLGVPVIATGWSGNTDFTTPYNSYLVDYAPRAVGPDHPPYDAGGTWAEPSVEHAASLMREVWTDQDSARARGARARADVERWLSLTTVGMRIEERLTRIAASRSGSVLPETTGWVAAGLDERLAFDRVGSKVGGARTLLKKTVLRGLRPFSEPQRQLDAALVESVSNLAAEVERMHAARNRDHRRIAALEAQLSRLTRETHRGG